MAVFISFKFGSINKLTLNFFFLIFFIIDLRKFFKDDGTLTSSSTDGTEVLWTKVTKVVGDGSNQGIGNLLDGTGPITLADIVPDTAQLTEIVYPIQTALTTAQETEITFEPTGKPASAEKILIVGGGPAGLEAARTAAILGHEVHLHEATKQLGGQVAIAASAPHRARRNRTQPMRICEHHSATRVR